MIQPDTAESPRSPTPPMADNTSIPMLAMPTPPWASVKTPIQRDLQAEFGATINTPSLHTSSDSLKSFLAKTQKVIDDATKLTSATITITTSTITKPIVSTLSTTSATASEKVLQPFVPPKPASTQLFDSDSEQEMLDEALNLSKRDSQQSKSDNDIPDFNLGKGIASKTFYSRVPYTSDIINIHPTGAPGSPTIIASHKRLGQSGSPSIIASQKRLLSLNLVGTSEGTYPIQEGDSEPESSQPLL